MNITLYSLSPICHRCVKMDPLVEEVCHQEGIDLMHKGFFTSMWFLLRNRLKPPVVLLDGQIIFAGRIFSKDELVKTIKEKLKT